METKNQDTQQYYHGLWGVYVSVCAKEDKMLTHKTIKNVVSLLYKGN